MMLLNQLIDYIRNVYIFYLVLMTSIFLYLTIYSAFIPKVHHSKRVHFEFDTKCADNCKNPRAEVTCKQFQLHRGQSYRFSLSLDMPESEVNWKQGMFMINVNLISPSGKILHTSSRPAILKQKSRVTRWLLSLAYWPFVLLGYKNEMQTVDVQLIDSYNEGPITKASLELVARNIQVYSASMHVYANLSGLSYYMYNWPVSSAIVGVMTLTSFISMVGTCKTPSSKQHY